MISHTTLPELRQNLQLMPGSCDEEGAPRWLLFDTLRNCYFNLSETAVSLLKHWQPDQTVDDFKMGLERNDIQLETEEITAFIQFLVSNHLVLARSDSSCARIYQQYQSGIKGIWLWLLHNYLFIKIPLIKPDKWLDRWVTRLSWLFSPLTSRIIIALGLIGIVMVIRQWDVFSSTFLYFFNTQGFLFYGLALAFVKIAHELGHAFTAKRQGCRVASMGIAFLVMFPVLYTDTTDAWKLRYRRSRLKIVTAGIKVEIYLALFATFFWNVLPDGTLRSVAFFIATTSWITSVLVNISPFLRFDGYYAFSDLLGIENLQQRAFAAGRWQLRKLLWGLDDPLPEPLSRSRARILVGYAWGTWIYRFFLFLGIAFIVYQFFFKLLGIILFAVEIIWFIGLPILREFSVWKNRKMDFKFNRYRIMAWLLIASLLIWAVLPLQVSVYLPAVVIAKQEQTLFAPEPAVVRTLYVSDGSMVQEGQSLLEFHSDELMFQLEKVEKKISLAKITLSRSASSVDDKGRQSITKQQLLRLQEQQSGLQSRINGLTIKAPFSGRLRFSTRLHEGRWVNPEMALLSLVDTSELTAEGFLGERELAQLAEGQAGIFIADQGDMETVKVKVREVSMGAVYSLPYEELGSEYSGPIAVRKSENDQLIPEEGHYRVLLDLQGLLPQSLESRTPGMVIIEGKSRSFLWHGVKQVLTVIVRESGF